MSAFLTSNFLAPAFFWFLGLIPVVVLLYLLKLRRTEVVIPSTMLWLKSLQDLTANAPFQRLRKNLLLFLQILALLLVVIALARPFVRAEGLEGQNLCVIVDRSASMQTVEEDGRSRLDEAKEIARDMAMEMAGGDKMMVVSFGESADVLCELTDDKYRIRRAIDSIKAADTKTNIRDALMIAKSLSPDDVEAAVAVRDLEIILLSDGKITDVDELGARATSLVYRRVGETDDNLGLVAFNVRPPAEGQEDHQTFVLIHNSGGAEATTTVTLYFNDSMLAVDEVTAPAGESREAVFSHPDLGDGVLRAEIDRADPLAADNEAWLALRPAAKIKVLLVAEGDSMGAYFLRRVLSLEPRVELSTVTPENYAPSDGYDLTLFDNFAPEALPAGMLVYFNAVPEVPGLVAEGEITNPTVVAKDGEHPAMRFINPGNVGIQKAIKLSLPDGAKSLLSTTGAPLIADVSQGDQQIIVVAFDVAASNWPLQLSFPLFVQNVVSWSPRALLAGETWVPTGSPLTLLPAPEEERASVRLPDGSEHTVELDPLRPVYFGTTDQAGIYTVERGGRVQRYAVNLMDRNESTIAPAESLKLGRGEVRGESGSIKQTRELWRWFVLGALAILGMEWWIYSRRAWF